MAKTETKVEKKVILQFVLSERMNGFTRISYTG